MKKILTVFAALLIGAALAAPALAAEEGTPLEFVSAPANAAIAEGNAYPIIEGFDYAVMQSAVSTMPGEIGYVFDGSVQTMCGLDLTDLPTRTVSIYMTSHGPYTLSALAGAISSAEENLSLKVSVFGTNDSLLVDWTQIDLADTVYTLGDYVVFTASDYADGKTPADPAAYQFYRVDLTLMEGNSFILAELVFFRPEGTRLIPVYDSSDGVEPGEEPIGFVEYNPDETTEVEEPEAKLPFAKPFARKIAPIPTPYK